MRRTTMVLAIAVGALTWGVLASPALAVKEKPVFGKFRATAAGTVKGIGEAGEMVIGPYKFEECEKELHSNGSVALGESETFFQEVKFKMRRDEERRRRPQGSGLRELHARHGIPLERLAAARTDERHLRRHAEHVRSDDPGPVGAGGG